MRFHILAFILHLFWLDDAAPFSFGGKETQGHCLDLLEREGQTHSGGGRAPYAEPREDGGVPFPSNGAAVAGDA